MAIHEVLQETMPFYTPGRVRSIAYLLIVTEMSLPQPKSPVSFTCSSIGHQFISYTGCLIPQSGHLPAHPPVVVDEAVAGSAAGLVPELAGAVDQGSEDDGARDGADDPQNCGGDAHGQGTLTGRHRPGGGAGQVRSVATIAKAGMEGWATHKRKEGR